LNLRAIFPATTLTGTKGTAPPSTGKRWPAAAHAPFTGAVTGLLILKEPKFNDQFSIFNEPKRFLILGSLTIA
jgi:hypothetical protein